MLTSRIRDRIAREGHTGATDGVLVQPMVTRGVEITVGATRDPVFGPVVAFGLGGIHVEILRDVCFGVPPLTDLDADEMIRGIRGFPLLEGYRGHPPADLAALRDVILRVAQLIEDVPEITELDLNPVFALRPGEGCRVVDARVRVAPKGDLTAAKIPGREPVPGTTETVQSVETFPF